MALIFCTLSFGKNRCTSLLTGIAFFVKHFMKADSLCDSVVKQMIHHGGTEDAEMRNSVYFSLRGRKIKGFCL